MQHFSSIAKSIAKYESIAIPIAKYSGIAKSIAKSQKYCKKDCKKYCKILAQRKFLKLFYSLLNFDWYDYFYIIYLSLIYLYFFVTDSL